MRPHEARSLCTSADVDEAVDEFRRLGLGAAALIPLLRRREDRDWRPWSGSVTLTDRSGRQTEAAVHVPRRTRHRQLGALIVLHGAGDTGAQVLPHFATLGDRLSMAVICPTAQRPGITSNNFDLAGIFGKRFDQPRWDLEGDDFPHAALRWARTALDADPDRCVIAGISMGGIATWNLCLRLHHLLAAAVPINGALSMWESFGTDRRTRALLSNTVTLPLFVVHGDSDERISPAFDRDSVAQLRALGHPNLRYAEVRGGGHEISTLGLRAGSPLSNRLERWLAHRRRARPPAEVRRTATDDRHGRAHWLQLGGITPRAVAEATARWLPPDDIRVDVRGATHVTLHLGSDRLTPGQPVKVSINRALFTLRYTPDLATVIRSYRDSADPAMAAEHIVTLPVPADRSAPEALSAEQASPC